MRKELFSLWFALCLFIPFTQSQEAFTGLFQASDSPTKYFERLSWSEVMQKQQSLSPKGFQLIDIETIYNQQQQFFWGLWQKDTSTTLIERTIGWKNLIEKKEVMVGAGYYLHEIEGYQDRTGEDHFISVWKRGDRPFEIIKLTSPSSVKKVSELMNKKRMYPVKLATYKASAGYFYLVTFYKDHPGNRTYVVTTTDKASFNREHLQRFKSSYRLIDFESIESTDSSQYLAIFKKGQQAESLQHYLNKKSFASFFSYEIEKQGLQLVDIEIFEGNGINRLPLAQKVKP